MEGNPVSPIGDGFDRVGRQIDTTDDARDYHGGKTDSNVVDKFD